MRAAKERARILVVDDDAPFRAYVCDLLVRSGFAADAVSTGSEALATVAHDRPAAMILDVNMPVLSGYEVCRSIRDELRLDFPILLVSGDRTESFDRVAGLTIGADDYMTKPFAPDELIARVRVLLRRAGQAPPPLGLTGREHQVLRLLAEGSNQKLIAAELVISPKTVATHIERILSKLGVHSRAEAVAMAYRSAEAVAMAYRSDLLSTAV